MLGCFNALWYPFELSSVVRLNSKISGIFLNTFMIIKFMWTCAYIHQINPKFNLGIINCYLNEWMNKWINGWMDGWVGWNMPFRRFKAADAHPHDRIYTTHRIWKWIKAHARLHGIIFNGILNHFLHHYITLE